MRKVLLSLSSLAFSSACLFAQVDFDKSTIILLSFTCFLAAAQKADTLTAAIRASTSIEQVLGLPAGIYTVTSCEIIVTTPKRGVFRATYLNPNAKPPVKFNEQWTQWLSRAQKGDKVLLTEIAVQRDDQKRKLAEKWFVVP